MGPPKPVNTIDQTDFANSLPVSARESSTFGPPLSDSLNHDSTSSNQVSTTPLPGVAPSLRDDHLPWFRRTPGVGVYQQKCFLAAGRTMKTPFFPDSNCPYPLMPKEAIMKRVTASMTSSAAARA